MKRWNSNQGKDIENARIDAFLEEIAAVCLKHGFSIAHEDGHGAFIIETFCEMTRDWLLGAHDGTQLYAAPQVTGTAANLPELRDRLDSSGPSGTAERVEAPKKGLIADQADVSRPVGTALEQIAFLKGMLASGHAGMARDEDRRMVESIITALSSAILAPMGTGDDLGEMCDLIAKVQGATSNGAALGCIAEFRNKVRKQAGVTGGIPEDMVLVNTKDYLAHRDALERLVHIMLDTRVPIGPMRDRCDYPPELQRAIDVLHGRLL